MSRAMANAPRTKLPPEKRVCRWEHDEDMDAWETTCDGTWQFTTGTPAENNAKFCPYCGGEIEEVK